MHGFYGYSNTKKSSLITEKNFSVNNARISLLNRYFFPVAFGKASWIGAWFWLDSVSGNFCWRTEGKVWHADVNFKPEHGSIYVKYNRYYVYSSTLSVLYNDCSVA